ncbi:hypothetical protein, partial [Neobacillus vireti]|uniref:spr1630 family ClpXP-sensitive toxin n=1 Tax=Neobacillus vireti TaxID=220686 RepID=UPI002FFE6EC1
KEFRFAPEVNQKVVDGILQGYKNYIHERDEKRRTMKISDAYAWVKGNHIDDQTARECYEAGITYKKAKAGYTWGYLQFSSSEDKSMFIIKNARYFNPDNVPAGRGVRGNKRGTENKDNYLKKLSEINRNVDFPETLTFFPLDSDNPEYLSIFDDNTLKSLENTEVSKLQDEYDKFYIITYEIDQAFMISKIHVWLPNPSDNTAYLVDDLSALIGNSSVDFTDVDISVLENDDIEYDFESLTAIDYDIVHDNQLDQEKKDNEKS